MCVGADLESCMCNTGSASQFVSEASPVGSTGPAGRPVGSGFQVICDSNSDALTGVAGRHVPAWPWPRAGISGAVTQCPGRPPSGNRADATRNPGRSAGGRGLGPTGGQQGVRQPRAGREAEANLRWADRRGPSNSSIGYRFVSRAGGLAECRVAGRQGVSAKDGAREYPGACALKPLYPRTSSVCLSVRSVAAVSGDPPFADPAGHSRVPLALPSPRPAEHADWPGDWLVMWTHGFDDRYLNGPVGLFRR
jgi:hypothetical protein